MTNVQPDTPAPDFDLPTDGTANIRLSDLRGRKVVLFFYPKDDTSGCTQEAIDFNRLKPEFESLHTHLIGMSPDSTKRHARFKTKHDLALNLASDETKETLSTYGVWVQKSMYGRKYMGVERTTFLISEQGIVVKIWNKVKVPNHAQEVLDAVRSLPVPSQG